MDDVLTERRTSFIRRFLGDRPTVIAGLTAGFFALTFAVYWITGPQETPYVHHVNQANAFLHGRLDIVSQYAKNANLLERALEDEQIELVKQGITPPPCGEVKCYLTHPPMPAIILLPLVAISGLEVNQALVSVFLAALTAALVYRVTRAMTQDIRTQVLFTVLFMFGTIFWYTAANGGVWFISHSIAVMFLFLAIYATLVLKNPLLAGIGLGAAYLTRNDCAWAIIFLVIMFSGRELLRADGPVNSTGGEAGATQLLARLARRVNLKALVLIAVGTLPFVLFSFWFNYARFGDILDSGYMHSEQNYQPQLSYLYVNGLFDISYLHRNVPVAFERAPLFTTEPPYVIPYGYGMAIWMTTPAFLYAFFAGVKDKRIIAALGIGLAAATSSILWTAASLGWDLGPLDADLTSSWQFMPFWAGIAVGIGAAVWLAIKERELLAIACWATIVPIALGNFVFAGWGQVQFGYRYALEFYPFLFLLTMKGMGTELKWHHMLVIALSVVVNLWAMLWIYEFGAHMTNGWKWYEFF